MSMKVSMRIGIKPYTKKELAVLYELSPRAFYTMFKPHEDAVGKKLGRYYSVKQVEDIFNKPGLPPCLLNDEFEKTKS